MARVLPPVHSPLSLSAVVHGWSGLLGDHAGRVSRVETLLRERYRSREVLPTDSGTTALALALRLAVEHRPHAPRVALPAWACYDLATAADTAGVEVLLYDLDPVTLGPDWGSLGQVLAAGVAAVVVVHPYGVPIDIREVARRTSETGTIVIEDAAQATGAWLGERRLGSWGDLAVLSFGRGKGWTSGGGGALLLNSRFAAALPAPASLAPTRPGLGAGARLAAQWLLARPSLYAIPSSLPFLRLGETVYRAPEPMGRMSGQAAGVLLATARLMELEFDRRRSHAARLREAVRAAGVGMVPTGPEEGRPSWLRLPLLPSAVQEQRGRGDAARRLGIMPGYPLPLSRLPGFAERVLQRAERFPGAELLASTLLTLPTHGQLTPGDLLALVEWIRQT